MSLRAADLDVLGDLAGAIGLTDESGSFRADWLSNPGEYLSSVLADEHQRDALVAFVDNVLGGEERTTADDGTTWLPIVERTAPDCHLYVVLDDRPSAYVGIGVGVRMSADNPAASITAHVPLFRAAKRGSGVTSPLLIGSADAVIALAADLTTDPTPPIAGRAHLGGVGLKLSVPTAGGGPAPQVSLTLRQLQMPGATGPRDLTVEASRAGELEGAVVDLVLGLVRAQAAAMPPGPLTALAGLLGLRDGVGVPPLPFHDLTTTGVAALATWLESVVRTPASRVAWIAQLASLLGGAVAGDRVRFTIGPAQLTLGVSAVNGSDGHTRLTPNLAIEMAASADAIVRAEADLCTIDLGYGTATALPTLALQLVLGHRPDGGAVLLDEVGPPHVRVETIRAGFAIDGGRHPVFVLAADGVTIGTHVHNTLDLSTPDAVADVAGVVLDDVADSILSQLGPAGDGVRVLLGLSAPAGHPAVPTVSVSAFLQDPLGAVAGHWQTVVHDHADAIPAIITTLRDLVADAAEAADVVAGAGTPVDPWRVGLAGPVDLLAWIDGDRLTFGPEATLVEDTLGQRCTRVESRVRVALATVDLVARHLSFLPEIVAGFNLRARGRTDATFVTSLFAVTSDGIAFALRWTPAAGLRASFSAPNLTIDFGDGPLPVPIPAIDDDGHVTLTPDDWDKVERLLGSFAQSAGPAWLGDLVAAFGWTRRTAAVPTDVHLRLADLATDPAHALAAWFGGLAVRDRDLLFRALETLSCLVGGTRAGGAGRVEGSGRPTDPWLVPLAPVAAAARLAVWVGPDGPLEVTDRSQPHVTEWSPGQPGFGSTALVEALKHEAVVADDVAALLDGRPDVAAGLDALVARWIGSDGRVVPPETDPAGVIVHRVADATGRDLVLFFEVDAYFDVAPATIVRVAVASADPSPWPDAPADRLVDLTTAGLAAGAFTLPAAATGEWFVALGGRTACRLATGDPDGIAGQAARLQRFFESVGGLGGGLLVIADAAAGHAARRAAEAATAVTDLITLGTPLGPVSFTVLDTNPAADTLRLLARLLPSDTDEISDDPDLSLGRGLVTSLTSLLPLDDPARELTPPSPLPGAPRAGLNVHAVFGVLGEEALRRAVTAIVAAGLADRSQARAAHPFVEPSELHIGLRVPVPSGTPTTGDPIVDGYVQIELGALTVDEDGPHLATSRSVRVHAGLARFNGWLVGGPDPARAPGVVPDKELRRVSFDVELPSSGNAQARSVITLHEPRAFGIERERWSVQAADVPAIPGVDAATPALPEVRVLLSGMAEALAGITAGPAGAFAAVLRATRLLAPGGGSVPDAVDHLLHDPVAHLQTTIANATDRDALVLALRSLFNGAGATPSELQISAGPATVTIDLSTRRIAIEAAATPGEFGLVSWSGQCTIDPASGDVSGEVTIGETGATVAGGLQLRLTTPARLGLRWYRPGLTTPDELAIWPSPDANAFARALARIVPAELLRVGLESMRELDETARPFVDSGLAAIGLLGPAAEDGTRGVLLPIALLADPPAWFAHNTVLGGASGFVPARFIGLVDGLKPILGVGGGPGEWVLAPGVTLRADTDSGGAARLSLALNTGEFTPIPGAAGRVTIAGSVGLSFPAGAAPRPSLDLHAGTGDGSSDRPAVHVVFRDDLRVFFRPSLGSDLPLYPASGGLGSLAQTVGQAITQALPFVLDRVAAMNGQAGVRGQVGDLVSTIGDALALRSGGSFSGTALQSWAADPAAALVARMPALTVVVLGDLADVVRPLLPGGSVADVVGSDLRIGVGAITAAVTPAPFGIAVSGEVSGVPAIARLTFGLALAAAGVRSLDIEVGPAEIDGGGVLLRPFFGVHAGTAPIGGRRAEVALGLGANRRVGARWLLGDRFDLVVIDAGVEETDPSQVVLALLDAVLDVVASFVMQTAAFTNLLNKTVGPTVTTVRDVLRGVLLDQADPAHLDANLFDPAFLLTRVQRLAVNLAHAAPSVDLDGLTISLAADDLGGGVERAGLRLSLARPVTLVDSDLTISLETDARWIHTSAGPPLDEGIVIDAIRVGPGAGAVAFAAAVSVNGVGLRFAKSEGPLLDIAGVTVGSIALHTFGRVGEVEAAGGVELQISDLAAGVGGASGGSNPVAQGILGDTGPGSSKLAPKFSPALAVQKHGTDPVLVSLRAGDGTGPWWLAIQKGFGPLYVEQVGFGVTVRQDQLDRISLLLDGRVSLLGLTASVDDLQLTFTVASNASVFDPSRWWVDLAGLAISSEIGGITLEGGLRKFGDGDTVQYVGMLLGRFAVYGLSVFGGYGHGVENGQRYASFFAFGAVNGPIGGPPAFFVTGIGGGLGINRQLLVPTDLSHFDQYPFIKALDPSAHASADPMAELTSLAMFFPQARGSFWFAAGVSFTSFALVDGIVVVSIQVGDGLQIALFGLARLALPRPEVALVSIELALVARFSSKEGVMWVQAQLTDNSWLLYPDVRLTGGFAFVTWFSGPNRGQVVLTIGGFHPRFHRDGYPEVPRLGLQWRVSSAIAIKGEAYFALTSEAIMAGGRLEVAADFGPAWAQLVLGADGIVYYDPFHYEVEVYASVKAGVTIDVWIGTITIRVSISGRVIVEGPKFHGQGTFGVGPVDITVEFGDRQQPAHPQLPWAEFVRKYLEEAAPGVARVLTAIPGKGSLPPGTGPGGPTDTGTADGSLQKPFTVFAEFEIMVTSMVPAATIDLGGAAVSLTPSRALGVAPMGIANAATTLHLAMIGADGDHIAVFQRELHHAPSFPVGVWGQPQHDDDRKVPAGDVIDAIDGIRLFAVANIPAGLPPIDYRRVDIGTRHPLPFVHESSQRPAFITEADDLAGLLPPGSTDAEVFSAGASWMARAGHGRTALAALRQERAGPPRFGSLTDGLAPDTLLPPAPVVRVAPEPEPVDTRVHSPVPVAVITAPPFRAERPPVRTTVAEFADALLVTTPTLERVAAKMDLAVPAQLHRVAGAAGHIQDGTVVASGAVPTTRVARGPVAAVAARGSLRPRLSSRVLGAADSIGSTPKVLAGTVVVLRFPNASRDLDEYAARPRLLVRGGPTRVVALGHGGEVFADAVAGGPDGAAPDFAPPRGTERVAIAVAGDAFQDAAGLWGWHAGTALAYIGWATALGAGSVVRAEGARIQSTRHRRTAGWIRGAELVAGTSIVITRFVERVTVVVVALDDPSGTDVGRNLSLGLTGASRRLRADASPVPPSAVVRANRTYLIYEIEPVERESVVITVASEQGWHLAGVMGGTAATDAIVELLTDRGLDGIVRPVLPGTTGSRTLVWVGSSAAPAVAPNVGPVFRPASRRRAPAPADSPPARKPSARKPRRKRGRKET